MSTSAQEILSAARKLAPNEQLQVLHGLAQSLAQTSASLAGVSAAFWSSPTIEELARESQPPVITDIAALAMPEWPANESADEFVAYIYYAQRQTDRAR